MVNGSWPRVRQWHQLTQCDTLRRSKVASLADQWPSNGVAQSLLCPASMSWLSRFVAPAHQGASGIGPERCSADPPLALGSQRWTGDDSQREGDKPWGSADGGMSAGRTTAAGGGSPERDSWAMHRFETLD